MGTSLGSQAKLPEVDLSQKTIVVTGANTGIGYEAAKALAQMGAKVILACRSETKANEAIERMRNEHSQEKADEKMAKVKIKTDAMNVEFMTLDLGSLASTMAFVDAYKAKGLPLHVLVCNAGLSWGSDDPTIDGHEIHFQVNYLAHFLLTLHLLPVLKTSDPNARIVNVSSLAYKNANWHADDIQCLKQSDKIKRYSNTKLYQIMQMYSLTQRLDKSGVSVFSLHPGVVDTDIMKRDGQEPTGVMKCLFGIMRPLHLLRNPFDGSLSTLHAAANPKYDGKTALYFEDGKPKTPSSLPRNKAKQEIIWKYSLDCLKDYITEDALKELTSSSA